MKPFYGQQSKFHRFDFCKAVAYDERNKNAVSFLQKHRRHIPTGINKAIGHFNVFKIDEFIAGIRAQKGVMPYNRRNYYKISLINGRNHVEYPERQKH